MTRQEEIDIVYANKPHVVILGAGASIASTMRNSEPSGKRLPSMYNITEVIGLDDIVRRLPPSINDPNFEKLYSALHDAMPGCAELEEINSRIYDYFYDMSLPDEPTIYDYLILSLRGGDIIATFNWDPFLYDAWVRNQAFFRGDKVMSECSNHEMPPNILFLHGNVRLGYDKESKQSGPVGYSKNSDGSGAFDPSQLLYPVAHKDYKSDPYISSQWAILQRQLRAAARVTVFGYSAPKTDVEAIELLKGAWGGVSSRSNEQFELLDIRPEQEVRDSWNEFIHSTHYDYCTSFFDSSLAMHPRRTYESYIHMTRPNKPSEVFQDGNPVPQHFKTLHEMWDWFRPLKEAERQAEK